MANVVFTLLVLKKMYNIKENVQYTVSKHFKVNNCLIMLIKVLY